ncbi:MAG: hypothetical protein K1X75_03455 [Leptospirales bacterium]|nr:hypothetical protein [Leptospirales bacterium]
MFSEYFSRQSEDLRRAIAAQLAQSGPRPQGRDRDLRLFQEFFAFLGEHLPAEFAVATGKVRSKKHLLSRGCDALIFRRWFPRLIEAAGGYVPSEALHAFLSLEAELTPATLATHLNLTRAMKTLYAGDREYQGVIPVFSVLFGYSSQRTLLLLRQDMKDLGDEKQIPANFEPDMIVCLDRGMLIKDWEQGGEYRVIETLEDTLLWFYILLVEYLDRDGRLNLNLRDTVKVAREYNQY